MDIKVENINRKLPARIGRIILNRKLREFAWLTLFFLILMGIFSVHFLPDKYAITVGQVAPGTIKASRTITFVDEKKTAEQREAAENSVADVFTINNFVLNNMEDEISKFYQDLGRLVSRDIDTREKARLLKRDYGLTDVTANVVVSIEPETLKILRTETIDLLETNWQGGVKESELGDRTSKILAQIELLNYNAPYREVIKTAFTRMKLQPDLFIDTDATNRVKLNAARNERQVLVTIQKGQKIVGEGEVVTEEQFDILRALGDQRTSSPYVTLGGVTLFLVLCIFLTRQYLKKIRSDPNAKENNVVLLGLLFTVTLLIAKIFTVVRISQMPEYADLVGYLIPLASGSMLIAILIDTRLAVFVTVILSFFVGILTGNQLTYAITGFVGGLAGIFAVSKFNQRLDWAKASLSVALANVVCIMALGLLNNIVFRQIITGISLGVINGFFSAVFAYGSLPFLESGFKVTTSVRLLELSNPGQPLLKRLMMEAPGTYHHSILVGNLAESAADAIGADSLLARVGSYYHDVGKLKRAYFFIENQLGGENPHEQLSPSLSTLIITSHVKDGLELARQYGLPPVIQDFIAQHHGTSIVTYFYHKALEIGNADTVKETDYRYNAPKPQSREAAIIMLADNVEAAVRSMNEGSSGKIEGLVRKIIKERLQDGQLDESALTFRDLEMISAAFTRILSGIFHSRIEYPEKLLEDVKGGTLSNGDTGRQPSERSGFTGGGRGIGS